MPTGPEYMFGGKNADYKNAAFHVDSQPEQFGRHIGNETPNLPAVIYVRKTIVGIGKVVDVTRDEVIAAHDKLREKSKKDYIAYRKTLWREKRDRQNIK